MLKLLYKVQSHAPFFLQALPAICYTFGLTTGYFPLSIKGLTMFVSLFYVLLAILGLSFLIFIHELGHYWMARRVGMRVETFSIGFGKPIYSWMRDGVKWQIGWLFLLGGYVKIAGEKDENDTTISPYDIPDSFYGKGPWARIKVAFMGPFTNLAFALFLFGVIWATGGRDKNFSEVTSKIGWVDPNSELYVSGVRPGDSVTAYDGRPFKGLKDHMYAAITSVGDVTISGYKAETDAKAKIPFEIKAKGYQNPFAKKGINTLGILSPANYFIYDRLPNGAENPLPEGSPLTNSGIQYGDRLVWVDGNILYSFVELDSILNDQRALLTIQRGSQHFFARVPRLPISELKLDPQFKEELIDWQFESNLKATKIQQLLAIPYNLTNDAVVENELKFIDAEYQTEAFPPHPYNALEAPLKPGDQIIAVDGVPVSKAYEVFKAIQTRKVNLIVLRDPKSLTKISSKAADLEFDSSFNYSDLQKVAQSIGTLKVNRSAGAFYLLNPVVPKIAADFERSPEKDALRITELLEKQKQIDSIEDPEKRQQLQQLLKQRENRLLLGIPYQDRRVIYNPSPLEMFSNVVEEISRTLGSLLTGAMSAEWLSGPVGIVKVVHDNWMISLQEALYWIAAISVNLGMLNLLPIPVLDGGTILLAFIEMITGKRINQKVMEWLVLPFAALLILFFIFVTYHDISNIFGH